MSYLKLKNCPFCGHKPRYYHVADRPAKLFAQGEDAFTGVCGCVNPDCPIHIVFEKVPGEPDNLNFIRNHFYVWQWNARWLGKDKMDKIEHINKVALRLYKELDGKVDIHLLRMCSDIYATSQEIKEGD